MKNKVNIEELSSIIKSARKYSLLGEYGNSLEKYQEAVSIIKQRQEEIKDDNDNIKEKWKMTEYNIKSEMLQIKDILQICLKIKKLLIKKFRICFLKIKHYMIQIKKIII